MRFVWLSTVGLASDMVMMVPFGVDGLRLATQHGESRRQDSREKGLACVWNVMGVLAPEDL